MIPTEPGRYWAYPATLEPGESIDDALAVVELVLDEDGNLTIEGDPDGRYVFLGYASHPGLVAC